jgi:L-2-hydroxyglutarate oxidase
VRPYDVIVVGAGIVGLAAARALINRRPGLRVAVLDKEKRIGVHQTGHNSGVIHSGIYNLPGTIKASLCLEGGAELYQYCEIHDIPIDPCGKVIVATREDEIGRLHHLYHRGRANGVSGLELIDPPRLAELEPHARGIKALWSPQTGIVDYSQVARAYAVDVRNTGGEIHTGREVLDIRQLPDRVGLETSVGDLECRRLVTCAGLQSDRLARMTGGQAEPRIVPIRGDYWRLRTEARRLCRGLIYPVPDPAFPFLGVHAGRRIGTDDVWVGPNAVLAFAREGYERLNVRPRDMLSVIGYRGFRQLVLRHWRTGVVELWRDYSKRGFLLAVQRLLPEVTLDDMIPGPSGVRAQAVDSSGRLVDDFMVETASDRVLHVRNAPSPAATASLSIGRLIANRAADVFGEQVA